MMTHVIFPGGSVTPESHRPKYLVHW